MRGDLPAGTVTFLFTDVEGSTKLLHELGTEQYAEALAEHRRIVRAACAQEGGVEVDTQGDAFFFAFASASGAMRAAGTIVGGLAPGPIRLRMGLHTGMPLLTEEGYAGPDVVRAARIAASGHGGQVLLSAETVESAGLHDSEAPAIPLRDLGDHRFKDLLAAERVFQLGDEDFPRIRSLYQTNLPVPPTSFLGREQDLADVLELLRRDEVGLLTLTGPGGTGKTRLALQAAAEAAESFPDGLWWVGLASLEEAHLVTFSLAQALGVEEEPGHSLATGVRGRLLGKRALLLIDNAEHLLPDVAGEIAALRDIAGPTVVVTSRERLQLDGEHVYAVSPLGGEDGIALFETRARAVGTDVRARSGVAELCVRLDNLPLALELAAARTVVFSPEQLLERLSERLDLLQAGREADPRQKTLRATIEWSYDLLDAYERTLFRGLSVSPGLTFESAAIVCGADPDTLQSLLDKSLLRRTANDRPRYWMLATIREFAFEQLCAEAEDAVVRRRHAEHYLAVARSSNLDAEAEGPQRHDLVIPERDNLRAALAWALESDERELGAELVVALENYWATNGPSEGVEWAEAMLEGAPAISDRSVSRALRVQGGMENMLGRPDRAEQFWQRALAIARDQGDERGVAVLLHRLATLAIQRGEVSLVRSLAEESLVLHRQSGFPKGEAQALTSLAEVAASEGDLEHALELLEESQRLAEVAGFPWWQSGVLARMGGMLSAMGRLEEARASTQAALRLSSAMGDRRGVFYELALLAEISARSGDRRHAGLYWGAAEAENERASVDRWLHGRIDRERLLAYADSEFERGRGAGRALPLDDAVALALDARSSVT